ncbi:ABC transporter ATP-binding protein [Denitratisoma sp. DHT3]|uniref:ABC transporter ATP-binding protein n=1 Tax=Denitratisoma sp. DHT3 TaxID=1981880 RepID=UPI0011985980|nr:ABC transporter ATP-binding protein [Denitratisoma sp. DHT3]QDX81555.1 ABC transporter ATP-binding protein [Denitratisoma sp. DHT3]
MSAALLEVRGLDVAIGGRVFCRDLVLRLNGGESLAILGRNGAGKSTLLATLAGLRPASTGAIEIGGLDPRLADPRTLARLRGYLPQQQHDPFTSTVLETVLVGRHPHLGRWEWEGATDRRLAETALAAVGLADYGQREVHSLSGGERQRLGIATLLTQAPRLFLLDEPLAHLDLNHQIAVLDLFATPGRDWGAAVAMVLHEPGLALRYCSRALLLFGDGEWLEGPSAEIINADNLSRLYGHALRELKDGGQRWFVPV